ncbi:DUF1508 domain-containing protein [Streptomyces mirabilis]|uniref:DUF1508 domain-containing protein n=1 Tax=Streptomyces mirabilis TaxID=68239 RepID=UPI0036AA23D7
MHHTAEGGGWVWRLRDGNGGAVAVSSRAYERHSTCRAAYERFRFSWPSSVGWGGPVGRGRGMGRAEWGPE